MEQSRTTMLLLLLLHLHTAESVQCFSQFVHSSLSCEGEIGEVQEEVCCLNTKYGFKTQDGVCHSCGPPMWSSWSEWSDCNALCGEGVKLRKRACYGVGQSECEKTGAKLQAEWCNGTCCNDEGWGPWADWSACSVTCGAGGVMRRERKCRSRPECRLACAGATEETQACPELTCPVHGGWSVWFDWSECSATCIDSRQDKVPTRVRRRTCSNPAPSITPPGNGCQGDSVQVQQCSELRNCKVDGGWGPWSEPGPCSVSCGEGLQLSHRSCDQPPSQFGGQQCEGPSTRSSICSSPCPVHSFWTGWSEWSECSGSCNPEGGPVPNRSRRRLCISSSETCKGPDQESGPCPSLSYCPVDGSWSPWSSFSLCSVTCGVGLQLSTRTCDRPAPKNGGRFCPGDAIQRQICKTQVQCPVDGVWSDWSSWSPCLHPFDSSYNIVCEDLGGSQNRERRCLHRALGGAECPIAPLTERRVCYDVSGCLVKGNWDGWEPWSQCLPACGANSKRIRRTRCKPDYSKYSPTIGRKEEVATFYGDPLVDCGSSPTRERQKCVNVPPCE